MKDLLKNGVLAFIYSNIYIALGAFALYYRNSLILLDDFDNAYGLALFSGTLSTYTLFSFFEIKPDEEKFGFIHRYKIVFQCIAVSALLISLICISKMREEHLPIFILCGSISFFYTVPFQNIIPIPLYIKALRQYPFVKIVLICLVWSLSTMPSIRLNSFESIPLFLELFFFFFGITIPFDIRDYKLDNQHQLTTFVQVWGLKNSLKVATASLLLSTLIQSLRMFQHQPLICQTFSIFILTSILSLLLIANSSPNRPEWYFTGLIDGLILLKALDETLTHLLFSTFSFSNFL